ncbi:beta-galactosidase [Candidatus Hydrogenedentota bacterium]
MSKKFQYYINTLWLQALKDTELLTQAIQRTKERGFNTVSLDLPWGKVETKPGVYDFCWFDERVKPVIDAGLNVQLRMNTGYSKPEWLEEKLGKDIYMFGPDGDIWDREAFKQLTYARDDIVKLQTDFYGACAAHYSDLTAQGRIMDFSAATDNCMESEYKFLDISPMAEADFVKWMKAKYESVEALSAKWGRKVSSWDGISLSTAHTADVVLYRTWTLKKFFKQAEQAVHSADKNAQFGVQFGSIWDAMGARRCAYNVSEMLDGVDWLHVADTPYYDHYFSMDCCHGMGQGIKVSNEGTMFSAQGWERGRGQEAHMDRLPTIAEADESQVRHAWESVERHITGYFLCNWQQEFLDDDLAGWTFFEKNAENVYKPVPERKVTKALFVSSWDQYLADGVNTSHVIGALYNKLSDGRTKPIDIVNEGVFMDHHERWAKYVDGVYFSKYSKHLTDAFVEQLSLVKVPLYAETPEVGTLDPYGVSRPDLELAPL